MLHDHLTQQGESGFECKVSCDDPPDLIVEWDSGDRWGVEVTRAYQQVVLNDCENPVSTDALYARLSRFADKLEKQTRHIRKRSYYLGLGPGTYYMRHSELLAFDGRWEKESLEAVRRHIEASETSVLKIPGAYLKPKGPGNGWKTDISNGVAPIAATISELLAAGLNKKVCDLERWNGIFAERWLLFLNRYPLANDSLEIEKEFYDLARNQSHPLEISGIFWYSCNSRSLLRLSTSNVNMF